MNSSALTLVLGLRNNDNWSRITPAGVRYQALLPHREGDVSVSGDYRSHMHNPAEGFPPPAPFHFSHSSTIDVGDGETPLLFPWMGDSLLRETVPEKFASGMADRITPLVDPSEIGCASHQTLVGSCLGGF